MLQTKRIFGKCLTFCKFEADLLITEFQYYEEDIYSTRIIGKVFDKSDVYERWHNHLADQI